MPLSLGDCFPESQGFIYIRVTSTRILPTQLITANIVSVLTFLFAGEFPAWLCLFLVADVQSHGEQCQPRERLHPAKLHSPALPPQPFMARREQKPLPKPFDSGSRISTWIWLLEQTRAVPRPFSGAEAQTHHHDGLAELPAGTEQLQPQSAIQIDPAHLGPHN